MVNIRYHLLRAIKLSAPFAAISLFLSLFVGWGDLNELRPGWLAKVGHLLVVFLFFYIPAVLIGFLVSKFGKY
jgi:formate hydrogenlyase subunit 4